MLTANIRTTRNKPYWITHAIHGHKLMRTGHEYANTNNKYGHAYIELYNAYKDALKLDTEYVDLAKLCLWIGITFNENLDIIPYIKRNTDALKWYKLGLHYLTKESNYDKNYILVKASLYNSIGVAYHHKTTRWVGGPIPQSAINNYNKARKLIIENPQYKKDFELLVEKLQNNSGHKVIVKGGNYIF